MLKFLFGATAVFIISLILQINLLVPSFILVLYIYLRNCCPELNRKYGSPLNLVLLYVIILALTYFTFRQGLSIYWLPFTVVSMLTALLFSDLRISMLVTVATAVTVSAIAGNNFYLCLLFIISGISSSILALGARRRGAIIRSGVITGFIQAASLFFIDRGQVLDYNATLILLANGIYSSIIVVGILPVFEYLFKTVTNISLLELADFHHPLLQRLIMEAPGTYHHSLIVGNLSDAACTVVGANSLLARIGAYYHDIGKLSKPEYFSENQYLVANKHDHLAPNISKIVIMNHVREGIELAKKYHLDPMLREFIMQHHGKSLVYYFYRRALENTETAEEIAEDGFRYPGPKPNSKETAVVLLADSVEAATRALKEPTAASIEDTVRKVINNKFIDGQLDECDLTLKDLEKIAEVFVRILSGIYHSRIGYPIDEKSENNHKKPAAPDTHQP